MHKLRESVEPLGLAKIRGIHIDASHSRQPLVKGERLVRNEVNAVMLNPPRDVAPHHGDFQLTKTPRYQARLHGHQLVQQLLYPH